MLVTRRAEMGDLQELLALYRHLTPDMPELSDDLAGSRWREVVGAGLIEAWARGCQRVMLVTGRIHRNPGVTDFYESCGFISGRAGLMAQRPSS